MEKLENRILDPVTNNKKADNDKTLFLENKVAAERQCSQHQRALSPA